MWRGRRTVGPTSRSVPSLLWSPRYPTWSAIKGHNVHCTMNTGTHCNTLHIILNTALHCIALNCTALHCTALNCSAKISAVQCSVPDGPLSNVENSCLVAAAASV